ncbi:MAG TPA: sialidase family protein [Candidatus Bathyarchaeia archaeon]|nr:sialidase family protein [Candidatus Bathyarchaeia archaeon]
MRNFILILLCFIASVSTCSVFGDSPGFTNLVSISKPGENSTAPQLIVSGNNVYVGWIDNNYNKFDIAFAKSTDGGSSFSTPVNLGNPNTQGADNLDIAESNDTIYAVWQSFSSEGSVIYFSMNHDGEKSFSSPVKLNKEGSDSAFPQIAVVDTHVYVSWLERTQENVTNVVFSKSDNNGNTFSTPIVLTHHSGISGLPQISADGNNVCILWEDNSLGNFDVFFAKSTDAGNTFGDFTNISNDKGESGTPRMVSAGNDIGIVWMDNALGNYDIMFSKSSDGGLTFSKPLDISNSKKDAGYPELTISGNNFYVTWTNTMEGNNYDIFFAKSSDSGQTFTDPINISNNPGASGWPQIAAAGDVYVSWVDSTTGGFDIYIAKSIDNGASFETPVNISNTPNQSWYNKMTVSPNTVYMVWQETNQANFDVVFSKSTTFVPEFGAVVPVVLVIAIISIVVISRRLPMRISL